MTLDELLMTELPLNRKERFFTGTVFPMIVAKDNFEHLHLLLSLLGINQIPEIRADTNNANILFFTEYSLVESLVGKTKKRFPNLPKTKDTPDIVIQIKSDTNVLIALEAKVYHCPSANTLNRQMRDQQVMLECMKNSLAIDKVYHYALLPKKFADQLQGFKYPVLTWEALYEQYEPVCQGDYFHDFLKLSLDRYDDLASSGNWMSGANSEKKMRGQQIYEMAKQGTLKMVSMGKSGGLLGAPLDTDLATDKWQTTIYETSSLKHQAINKNWFSIDEFLKRIDQKNE